MVYWPRGKLWSRSSWRRDSFWHPTERLSARKMACRAGTKRQSASRIDWLDFRWQMNRSKRRHATSYATPCRFNRRPTAFDDDRCNGEYFMTLIRWIGPWMALVGWSAESARHGWRDGRARHGQRWTRYRVIAFDGRRRGRQVECVPVWNTVTAGLMWRIVLDS